MDYKLLTGRENNELALFEEHLFHKGIIEDFSKLKKQALKEINCDLQVLSSFRNYETQQRIWLAKESGKRVLNDKKSIPIEFELLSNPQLLEAILYWSAIPGVSRHHWGTDIDIFDASKLNRESVQLTTLECIEGGVFEELHLWLDEKIKTQSSFGFYRPYDKDRGGTQPEKWHLSHKDISLPLYNSYTIDIFTQNIEESNLMLKDLILKNAQDIYHRYFLDINLGV